ncbi:MAG: c-type cytochrome [Vicinamibacterales bacterium]
MISSRLPALVGAGLLLLSGAFVSAQQAPSVPAGPLVGDAQQGRYLVENVAQCAECHSSRDQQGEILPETRFLGGPIPFAPAWPNNWAIRAPRIKGLTGYTDEAAMRLLTGGSVGRDGTALRRPMPTFHMSPQDAANVIAYLRSLP